MYELERHTGAPVYHDTHRTVRYMIRNIRIAGRYTTICDSGRQNIYLRSLCEAKNVQREPHLLVYR